MSDIGSFLNTVLYSSNTIKWPLIITLVYSIYGKNLNHIPKSMDMVWSRLCFVVCFGNGRFTHILQGYFIGIELTHLSLDEMDAILADNFKCIFFLNEKDRILIRISLKFVSRSLIDNKPALAHVMAWRRTGDKPLPEPMLTLVTDAYMQQQGKIS